MVRRHPVTGRTTSKKARKLLMKGLLRKKKRR